jgi:hypothetical protein
MGGREARGSAGEVNPRLSTFYQKRWRRFIKSTVFYQCFRAKLMT